MMFANRNNFFLKYSELEQMTKPEDYIRQLEQGLVELDKISPSNSKILVTGMADGRILWKEMSGRRHPFGNFNN